MLRILKAHGLAHATKRVFLQSFEQSNLRELDRKTDLPLIQLMDASGGPYDQTAAGHPVTYAQLATKKGLKRSRGTPTASARTRTWYPT